MNKWVVLLVVFVSLFLVSIAFSGEIIYGTQFANGVYLYSAGLSAGTTEEPTGEPAGAPTDNIVSSAVDYSLLEYFGDEAPELHLFHAGEPEPERAEIDYTVAEIMIGLAAIDDFGYLAANNDDDANADLGTGGSMQLRPKAVGLVIVPDGSIALGVLGPSEPLNAEEAEAALDGCEIFIFEDGELSGMTIQLRSAGNNIRYDIPDRWINPNTELGSDDTLIAIDLDSIDGFNGTYIDKINIYDDGIEMTAPPKLWGDTSVEIDAVAVRVNAILTIQEYRRNKVRSFLEDRR